MKNISHVYETPPAGANTDWTVPQNWDKFTADQHAMWDRLFAR
jgi:phenylalanine-4-hydroxylase